MRAILFFVNTCLTSLSLFAHGGSISGVVSDSNGPLAFATVGISALNAGAVTDVQGKFTIDHLEVGSYQLVARAMGYTSKAIEVVIEEGKELKLEMILVKSDVNLDQVVVTGTGSEIPLFEAPIIVSRIGQKAFDNTQSLTLAEGLSFSPGLRLENNCQNCGFTQLRMNGLDGAYSQILINSRPIFSALMGVYGLDLIPANMIDRVEVVRGGGSALYGGNAIAGTVNIITKDPLDNSFQVGLNQALINGEASDRSLTLNGSIVSDDLKMGLNLYGFDRSRDHWDANGDGFSEITLLENSTFGFDAFFKPGQNSRLDVNAFAISEYRRGGNKFDLEPHQTDITEEIDHRILGGALSYELFFDNYRQKIALYSSVQTTDRDSYYGGGGRVLTFGDSLTEADVLAINAYGTSEDLSAVGGARYTSEISSQLDLFAGTEFQYNSVSDRMPGYGRSIVQEVGVWGSFAQFEYKPIERLSILAGGRYDLVSINGDYNFGDEDFVNDQTLGVFVPRVSLMYDLSENLKFRGSYAQGYRAPQAFDEDLHIETVGGAAVFTQLDPELTSERSNSFTASLNHTKTTENFQTSFVIEGFLTDLIDPFITTNQMELPSGVAVVTKRNGSGARVSGVNLEANAAIQEKWLINGGLTIQSAQYDEEEVIWSPDAVTDANADSIVSTDQMLRTPDIYGYLSLTYRPTKSWSFTYSGVYTGSMEIAHVIDPDTEYTIIEETLQFFESNIKAGYTLQAGSKSRIEIFAGVQNIFNAYQNDFDIGVNRDAGYIYGPNRPRTIFFGVKWGME
ncbi:TonB-dependent receptor [Cryomorphaceae bacterium 1068]|nr:TonB-dependent receptor [Cryomorphaceae bacterium 1068]